MIPKELFKKIRQIEITTNRMVTDIFAGQYHSVFKGQGIEFNEVREYQRGDDIRTIDWNVTARAGQPHVKKFIEERELNVMILVDASRSSYFGTVNQLKSNLAAEVAAVLAYSAIRNSDKVGLIIFTDRVEKYIPPSKGISHVLRVIREILYFKPEEKGTDIPLALDYLNKIMTRRSVAFLISDFFTTHNQSNENGKNRLKQAMSVANRRHDLVAITLNDPREQDLSECGLIYLEDAETQEKVLVDSSDPEFCKEFRDEANLRIESRKRFFRSMDVDHIDISTDVPYSNALIKFFKQRKNRI